MNRCAEEITATIVAEIAKGVIPWSRSWGRIAGPRSFDGRPYGGINLFIVARWKVEP